jgi:two-component system, NtrC family, sensor histidine kinase HydH
MERGLSAPASRWPRWRAAALAAAGIAITSAGHYLTPAEYLLWHGLFQRLYYLPVVYAAIAYGWQGGLAAAAVSGALYIPHIMTTWAHQHHYAWEQYAEIFMFLAVGLVTGVLADRERRRRAELQALNVELQNTFEQVKRADRLSAIGQLAAGLAHEIRNPLASIDGAAEVLQASGESEPLRRETLEIIRRECGRLFGLLTRVLDFARPRSPQWKDTQIAPLLESVAELVGHSAGKGVQLRCEAAPGLPALRCDAEQLEQVILNLAINAVQAMPQGGEVLLSASAANGEIVIAVRDQGQGISEENLDKVFDPFFTTKDTGTGLGLSVAHQIVTQHGGAIGVKNLAGGGAEFVLRFPASVSGGGR